MAQSNCQVCGNPMHSQNYYGTDENGSLNSAFCSNCYQSGKFYSKSLNSFTSEDVFSVDSGYSETFAPSFSNFAGRGFGFYAANKK